MDATVYRVNFGTDVASCVEPFYIGQSKVELDFRRKVEIPALRLFLIKYNAFDISCLQVQLPSVKTRKRSLRNPARMWPLWLLLVIHQ